jgi:hypothetical protein
MSTNRRIEAAILFDLPSLGALTENQSIELFELLTLPLQRAMDQVFEKTGLRCVYPIKYRFVYTSNDPDYADVELERFKKQAFEDGYNDAKN